MRALLASLALALTLFGAARAEAYPQYQLSTGAKRCNLCHFAPAGGGLINGYGRDEAGDTISRGGDGSFLHGYWTPPSWLALGVDLRGAVIAVDEGNKETPELEAFPMQDDVYARFQLPANLSFSITGGYRPTPRNFGSAPYSTIISREHYLMWRPKSTGLYVRAGRFFAPFGLRVPEHPDYVRRFTGFNTLEETYNLSGGYITDDWELHATLFTPDFLRPIGQRGKGLAVYGERRFGDNALVGMDARASLGPETDVYTLGVTGKYWLEKQKLLFMLENDYQRQQIGGSIGQNQMVSYLDVHWFVRRGWEARVTLERWDEDMAQTKLARDAVDAEIQYFPWAHFELNLWGRWQSIGDGAGGDPLHEAMLQLHYYL